MKIRRLHIKNLRLIEDLELDFVDPRTGKARNWTVIIAENGRGKSSVLQSIALAAAGRTHANSLAGGHIPSMTDRRTESPRAVQIGAEFELPEVHGLGFGNPPPRECPGSGPDEELLSSYLTLQPDGGTLIGQSWYGPLPDAWSDERARPAPRLDDPLDQVRSKVRPWWFAVGYGTDRRLRVEPRKAQLPETVQPLGSLFWPDVGRRGLRQRPGR